MISRVPRVVVLSLGGTIATASRGDQGALPRVTPNEILETLPGIEDIARVSSQPVRQVMSSALSMGDLFDVVDASRSAIEQGADGIVITTGTDTLEEVAFALDQLWALAAPLVVTGSMRSADQPGADGAANLADAIVVASTPATVGLGALVVMNAEVHAARFVQKTHTSNPAAVRSPLAGPIGVVQERKLRMLTAPTGRPPSKFHRPGRSTPVALIRCGLDDDGRLLGAVMGLGYRGLVVEALGGGAVPPSWVDPLDCLVHTIPVILSSRVPSGEVLHETYDAVGCEKDLIARGLIPSGLLDGTKSRILLTLSLQADPSLSEIRRIFENPYL